MSPADRYLGCVVGLAAGDALGTTLEFTLPGSFEPLTDMVGGGPFGLRAGHWTDDTSMALCLAESLIECDGFDAADQMRRYLRWMREGHLSSTGSCFDVGNTVRAALEGFERTGNPFAGSSNPSSAGNGCIMRLAPVPMRYAGDPRRAVELSGDSSRTTHGARECVDACRYFGALLVGALTGASKDELLGVRYAPVPALWAERPLAPRIDEIALGSFKRRNPPEIRGTGYVVDCLEAALWALHNSDDFHDGALLAVNLGADADTSGAVFGQLAGALYGVAAIPPSWRERLALRETIERYALALLRAAESGPEEGKGQQAKAPGRAGKAG